MSQPEIKHFRIYKLDDNFEVWIGKNSASNDLLTKKFTGQNDLWFHVRGYSGSHTILKKLNDEIDYTKEAIKTAAAYAAFYSKAKNAKNVTVAYTEGKNVHKFKGAKSGTVVIDKERKVKVDPEDPNKTIDLR